MRGEALQFSLSEPPPLPSGESEDGALIHISAMLGNRSLGNQLAAVAPVNRCSTACLPSTWIALS